jgi:predicted transcriptional regulator
MALLVIMDARGAECKSRLTSRAIAVTIGDVTFGNNDMPRSQSLGSLEQQVLEFLWRHSPTTTEAVRSSLSSEKPLADSTIRTVLRRLEAKGYVNHRLQGQQFLYSSARPARMVAAEGVRDILRRFCRGSVEELLAGMVDHRIVKVSELRRLTEKIETLEREAKKK